MIKPDLKRRFRYAKKRLKQEDKRIKKAKDRKYYWQKIHDHLEHRISNKNQLEFDFLEAKK